MWIHFAGALYSAMTIFVLPLLVLAAMAGVEILLDRTLRLFSNRAAKSKRQISYL
jgi:hypothetical protein